jgi:hypothetical protein
MAVNNGLAAHHLSARRAGIAFQRTGELNRIFMLMVPNLRASVERRRVDLP